MLHNWLYSQIRTSYVPFPFEDIPLQEREGCKSYSYHDAVASKDDDSIL